MSSRGNWRDAGIVACCALMAFGVGFGLVEHEGMRHGQTWRAAGTVLDLRVVAPGGAVAQRWVPGPRPTILLVFDDSCTHCREEEAAWIALARWAQPQAAVAAVSLNSGGQMALHRLFADGLVEYLGAAATRDLTTQIDLSGVPFTALVSPLGVLLDARQGIQSEGALRRMIAPHLGIPLVPDPGESSTVHGPPA